MKIEYIVRVVSTKQPIRIFSEEDDAISWMRAITEIHGNSIAKREVIRRETIINEEVIANV